MLSLANICAGFKAMHSISVNFYILCFSLLCNYPPKGAYTCSWLTVINGLFKPVFSTNLLGHTGLMAFYYLTDHKRQNDSII